MRELFRSHDLGVEIGVVEQPTPLGTAGAIKNVQRQVRGTFAGYNGDVVDSIDFDRLVQAHRKGAGNGTIPLSPVEDPSAFGVVANEGGRITRFVEKPSRAEAPSNLVKAGRAMCE